MKGGKMVNEKTEVTSLFGTYYAKSAEMLFRQNVRVNHPDYQLTSDSLLYNMKYKRSIFKTSTKIENDSGYIFCNSGWYDEQNNQSSFGRNTYIFNTNSWLLTDSIFYDKKNKKSHIYKTFEYHDTASKIHLFGDSAVMYDDDNRILAFKRPTLIIESVENKEPTFVRGNTLDSRTVAGKKRKLVATKNVRLFNKEFQAKSDTMIYTEVDSTMILKKDPIMWHEKDQISGKILKIQMDQKSPKVIYVYQEAFLAQEEDVRTHYNQVSGDTVIIYFENKNISELTSKGSAKSIYYAKEEGKGYLGINSSQSERMKTIFDSSKPSRVIFYDNPKATFIPAKQIDEINRYLPNFKWYDALRPKSKDDI
jgi:lipopolysaccharide export system protein LptA